VVGALGSVAGELAHRIAPDDVPLGAGYQVSTPANGVRCVGGLKHTENFGFLTAFDKITAAVTTGRPTASEKAEHGETLRRCSSPPMTRPPRSGRRLGSQAAALSLGVVASRDLLARVASFCGIARAANFPITGRRASSTTAHPSNLRRSPSLIAACLHRLRSGT